MWARIEHPFLLSDNRHFVFYIWRRTIKYHPVAKYLAVPIYYAAGWLVLETISYSQSLLFVLGFITCTALTIVPSPLLEFRYFVLPYLFWRLHISPAVSNNTKWRGISEYLWYEMINLTTLWIFVAKPFEWDSEPGKVQRFIW
jgi:alpha-1,2-glucosyltransferase